MFAILVILSVLLVSAEALGSSYDFVHGNASLWHSIIPYCDTNSYLTRSYIGYSSSFLPTAKIEDKSRSTYGYVGVQPNINSIFVTFRGSEDLNNWITNLDAVTTSYPGCSKCDVHKGFYVAEQSVFPGILSAVKALKTQYPSFTVIATGHSLGAALATLTALDLSASGISPVKLFNYGSPRVGNTAFSNWASTKVAITRSTHYKVYTSFLSYVSGWIDVL